MRAFRAEGAKLAKVLALAAHFASTLTASALADAPLADEAAARARFREATYLEEALLDLEAAARAYQEVAAAAATPPETAAQARRRAAACLALRGAPAGATATAARAATTPDASVDGLDSEDPALRYRAIEELRAIPPGEAVAALLRRLGPSAGPRLRHYGAILLGHLKDPAAAPALAALLLDPIPEVRCNAALALWKLGDARGLPVLEEELGSALPQVRTLAAHNLAQAGSLAAAPALVIDLASPDAYVREGAIAALAKLFGDDLGYAADAPEDAREEARRRWVSKLASEGTK